MAADPAFLGAMSTVPIDLVERLPNSSNATYLVRFDVGDGIVRQGVYKPLLGERPLWDFEPGLWRHEVAAFRLCEALGWDFVPPTVACSGPLGEGSLQVFVEHDPAVHYFTIHEEHPELHDALRRIAVFDIVANNTDRKGGHVLLDVAGRVRGIDHGVCFSPDFKLRTVVWDFGGEDMDDGLVDPVRSLLDDPSPTTEMLSDDEVDAMLERAQWVVDHARFPSPTSRYQYPWPIL